MVEVCVIVEDICTECKRRNFAPFGGEFWPFLYFTSGNPIEYFNVKEIPFTLAAVDPFTDTATLFKNIYDYDSLFSHRL